MGRPAYSDEYVGGIQQQIHTSALRVCRRDGYRGVTLRAIAREMDWTAAALYRYFKSKDELFASIRAEGFIRLRKLLEAHRGHPEYPIQSARHAMRAVLDFALQEPEVFRLMFEINQGELSAHPAVQRERERCFQVVRQLADGVIAARGLDADRNTVAHLFWVSLHGLIVLALSNQLDMGRSFTDLVDPMIDLLIGERSEKEGN